MHETMDFSEKRILRLFALCILISIATILALPQSAFAERIVKGNDVYITPDEGEAWTYVKLAPIPKGTKANPAVINIAPGNYVVPRTEMQNYTTINAVGAHFMSSSSGGFFYGGQRYPKKKGYSHLTNVTINGGEYICDKSNSKGSIIKFSHAKNINLTNFAMRNCYGTHFIELVGVKNAKLTNLDITGVYTLKDKTNEAIQLDNALNERVAPKCKPFDGTPCKSIKITNCNIIVPKMPIGIGTNSACKKRSTKISITGCQIAARYNTVNLPETKSCKVKNNVFYKSKMSKTKSAKKLKASKNKFYKKIPSTLTAA